MFRLIYVSKVARRVRFEDAEQIAESSSEKNAAADLSGLLVYTPSHFVQVLEGDQGKVQAYFDRIKEDDRHEAVRIVSEESTDQRMFGKWAMKALMAGPQWTPEALEQLDREEALHLLMDTQAKS